MIEARIGNIYEVLLGDPSVPVVLERRCGDVFALEGRETPFIDDFGIIGVIEEVGRNPWLNLVKTGQYQRVNGTTQKAVMSTNLEDQPPA